MTDLNGRKSIAFCLSARTGLGHLRRVTNIATQVREQAPQTTMSLLTNAPPSALSRAERALFANVVVCERADMARHLHAIGPDLIAVDTAVIPRIELLPQPLVFILRQMPRERLASFRLPNARLWDAAIVAAPASDWSPNPDVLGAHRILNVGWIYRTPEPDAKLFERRDGERVLLLATGGGGGEDNAAFLAHEFEQIIAALRARHAGPLRIVQAAGPRMPKHSAIAGADAVIDVHSQLDQAFASADAVISTAGYNSVLELALTSTPAVLCPIPRTYDDQSARVTAWAPRVGFAHRVGEAGPTALWLSEVLSSACRRPPAQLDPSGAVEAAACLVEVLARAAAPDPARHFVKAAARLPAEQVIARSGALFAAGVATPPAMPARTPGSLAFAAIGGPTAAQAWERARAASPRAEDLASERDIIAAAAAGIAGLHRACPAHLRLPAFDPWLRITPRLVHGSKARAALGEHLGMRVRDLCGMLADRHAAVRPGNADHLHVVHGDFHLGQLIAGTGAQGHVIVDLDDLALGEREADIANCIAHIVTSPALHGGPVLFGFLELVHAFSKAYLSACGARLHLRKIQHYGAIALLRRALKLAERGETANCAQAFEAAAMLAELTAPKSTHVPVSVREAAAPAARAAGMLSTPD